MLQQINPRPVLEKSHVDHTIKSLIVLLLLLLKPKFDWWKVAPTASSPSPRVLKGTQQKH